MKGVFCFFVFIAVSSLAQARNITADMLRNCEGLYVGTTTNYVLKCPKTDDIVDVWDNEKDMQFFMADNNGDERGTFLDKVPEDTDFIYVNVASELEDARYQDQTCYRFIREKDIDRDGFYAVQVCEYDRPDSYL